jgi:RNA polymerase sigma factor (sigma-70 family)
VEEGAKRSFNPIRRSVPVDERELRALATAAQRGDETGFRTLVEGLSRTLLAMAYRYTGDWEWARDLTQETWIRVHEQLGHWDPGRSFTAWLYAIHRNGCRDHLRRPWVERERTSGDGAIYEIQEPSGDDPEKEMERREFRERILAASDRLSQAQREVFLRVDVEQGDQREVAEALGIRFGTLRTTLHFARRKVAAALREMEEIA